MSTKEQTTTAIKPTRGTRIYRIVAWITLSIAALTAGYVGTLANSGQTNYVPIKVAQGQGIKWQPDFETAQAVARKSGKPLMINFFADWCGVCKRMDNQTFPDRLVVDEARNFVSVRVNTDKRVDVAQQFAVSALPTILWLDGKGRLLGRVSGLYAPDEFAAVMQKARSQTAS